MHLIDRGCLRSKTSSDWLWIHLDFETSKNTKNKKKKAKTKIDKETMFWGLVGSTSSHVQTSMENMFFLFLYFVFLVLCVWFQSV